MSPLRLAPILLALSASPATSGPPPPSAGKLLPVLSIAKSENKNQVQYVVRVDDRCVPVGPAPVSAYWRMLERGPNETAPLLVREVRAYGLASQAVVASAATGGKVVATLNALPSRPVTIETQRGANGECRALATATITGAPAHIFNVYVHLKWDGVDYLLLQGWSMDGTHVLREQLAH
jgi:hypothetical protein